jgi:hypothetical protein
VRGYFPIKETIMLLPIFIGSKYGYSYEPKTGNYLLYEYKSQVYLQGDDARIFQEEIERIDDLPEPEYKTDLLTENAIGIYF